MYMDIKCKQDLTINDSLWYGTIDSGLIKTE